MKNRTFDFVLLICLCCSCVSSKTTTDKESYGISIDKNWQKFVKHSTKEVCTSVNEYHKGLLADLGEEDLPLYCKRDMSTLDAYPVDVYYIDSITLSA